MVVLLGGGAFSYGRGTPARAFTVGKAQNLLEPSTVEKARNLLEPQTQGLSGRGYLGSEGT